MTTTRAANRFGSTLLAMGLFAVSLSASAEDVKVTLTGAEEVPAVTTQAKGEGTITIAKDMSVTGSVKTSGVEGIAAHIHLAEPGKNGPPVVTLTKGEDGSWSAPAGSKLTEEQYQAFKAGHLYVNVHSAAHKGGEIRGQLKP
ncbi:CHRD domain-containing protein [Steroidobacter cummioxidans]|uniref:CHRD domain-containing protein n=1 Tax=Steroidobacter cummioxidans TaxID=1803913 RepID=UPI000E31C561|nr:CHRD domain-containing protein [Steroidobacter cummioxidans]